MSVERMLPLTSMASMMADRSAGTGSGSTGRAVATMSTMSESARSAGGRCRILPPPFAAMSVAVVESITACRLVRLSTRT